MLLLLENLFVLFKIKIGIFFIYKFYNCDIFILSLFLCSEISKWLKKIVKIL